MLDPGLTSDQVEKETAIEMTSIMLLRTALLDALSIMTHSLSFHLPKRLFTTESLQSKEPVQRALDCGVVASFQACLVCSTGVVGPLLAQSPAHNPLSSPLWKVRRRPTVRIDRLELASTTTSTSECNPL